MPSTERAVVLGGGIGGLLAAAVLAERYGSVVVVERDRLNEPGHRRGVPQGQHVHGLLPRGLGVVEDLLPGYTEGLVADGLPHGDVVRDVRWIVNGRLLRQSEGGLPFLSGSRPRLEGAIRSRVRALPGVTVLDGYDVVGVSASPDRRRITAARVTSVDGQVSRVLPADLVVDATGRASRTPRWLAELGYPAPEEDRVDIGLSYCSRMFEAPADGFEGSIVALTGRFPGQKRSAVMQVIEGGRALVSLTGVVGETPPADLDGFIAYAETLPAPDTYAFVRDAKPLGEAIRYRMPTYVRRHYERLTDMPAGLLVTGDALCNFNPIYAQGMTVAALDAAALREEVGQGEPDAHRYFTRASVTVDPTWMIGVGGDLAVEGVTGPPLPPSPLTPDYLRRLQLCAAEDADLARAFIRVSTLIDPPPALLRPEVVERVERMSATAVA